MCTAQGTYECVNHLLAQCTRIRSENARVSLPSCTSENGHAPVRLLNHTTLLQTQALPRFTPHTEGPHWHHFQGPILPASLDDQIGNLPNSLNEGVVTPPSLHESQQQHSPPQPRAPMPAQRAVPYGAAAEQGPSRLAPSAVSEAVGEPALPLSLVEQQGAAHASDPGAGRLARSQPDGCLQDQLPASTYGPLAGLPHAPAAALKPQVGSLTASCRPGSASGVGRREAAARAPARSLHALDSTGAAVTGTRPLMGDPAAAGAHQLRRAQSEAPRVQLQPAGSGKAAPVDAWLDGPGTMVRSVSGSGGGRDASDSL